MKDKKLIRLTEADIHKIVKESVNKVLNEDDITQQGALLGNRSTLQPKDVNFVNYQPTDRIGVIMSSLSQLWKMDKEYTLEIINRALGTNFSI